MYFLGERMPCDFDWVLCEIRFMPCSFCLRLYELCLMLPNFDWMPRLSIYLYSACRCLYFICHCLYSACRYLYSYYYCPYFCCYHPLCLLSLFLFPLSLFLFLFQQALRPFQLTLRPSPLYRISLQVALFADVAAAAYVWLGKGGWRIACTARFRHSWKKRLTFAFCQR